MLYRTRVEPLRLVLFALVLGAISGTLIEIMDHFTGGKVLSVASVERRAVCAIVTIAAGLLIGLLVAPREVSLQEEFLLILGGTIAGVLSVFRDAPLSACLVGAVVLGGFWSLSLRARRIYQRNKRVYEAVNDARGSAA